jgi:hypothetical protein
MCRRHLQCEQYFVLARMNGSQVRHLTRVLVLRLSVAITPHGDLDQPNVPFDKVVSEPPLARMFVLPEQLVVLDAVLGGIHVDSSM